LEHLEKMSKTGMPWRMAERYRMMMDQTTDPPAIDPQVLWFRVNSLIAEFMAGLPENRGMRIRGEDLISNPAPQCTEIAQWLGVRSDASAINEMLHPENSPFACIGPPNAMFGGDPKFFREPALRSEKIPIEGLDGLLPWREDKSGLKTEVVGLAETFGYRRTAARLIGRPKRDARLKSVMSF
jgi:hypothetical protein